MARLRQLEEQYHAGDVGNVPSEQNDDDQVHTQSVNGVIRAYS